MSQLIIGLTGSIASGKSTISEMLKEKGYPIVDADKIARLVVEPGTPSIQAIQKTFGREVLHEDGSLNREVLGRRIFGNEEERNKLNAIMHPAIRAEMMKQKETHLANGENTVVMDIPLLFESKLESFVDQIIVVSVHPDIQKKRLLGRNQLTVEEAENRIGSQLPMAIKEAAADAIIDNNGTVESSKDQLESILRKWGIEH